VEYIDACLHLSEYPVHGVAAHDIDLFHTVAVVKVPPHLSIGLEGEVADFCLPAEVDHLNFRELAPGTVLGFLRQGAINAALAVTNEAGEDVGERYFSVEESTIKTRTAVMPSMLTMDTKIIRQDCLCYLMERLETRLHS